MVRAYDRALLHSSGRIDGDPFEPLLDRFAIRSTGTRMRASGLRRRIGSLSDDYWLEEQLVEALRVDKTCFREE